MKPRTYTVSDDRTASQTAEIVRGLDLSKVWEVVVRLKKKNRSASQNALMWMWLEVIANDTGHTREELHQTYKREHLVPIFRRDRPGYKAMIKAVGQLKGQKGFAAVVKEIVRLTSTTDCTVEQFTEYLNAIEVGAAELGITLPHPDDIFNEAMGRKEHKNGK